MISCPSYIVYTECLPVMSPAAQHKSVVCTVKDKFFKEEITGKFPYGLQVLFSKLPSLSPEDPE